MRNYELLFILDPAMDEAARNQMIETVKGIINADGEKAAAETLAQAAERNWTED